MQRLRQLIIQAHNISTKDVVVVCCNQELYGQLSFLLDMPNIWLCHDGYDEPKEQYKDVWRLAGVEMSTLILVNVEMHSEASKYLQTRFRRESKYGTVFSIHQMYMEKE